MQEIPFYIVSSVSILRSIAYSCSSTVPDTDENPLPTPRTVFLRKLAPFKSCQSHLDRYFFQRYVRTLLKIFAPAALVILPILIPINYVHGKSLVNGVSGLDTLGWSNVGLNYADRYWAHLVLSLLFATHICRIIWTELTAYVSIRQGSKHTAIRTVLVDSIPDDWMSERNLRFQLRVFPGKIDAISFNRDFTSLSKQVKRRQSLVQTLEAAETRLIRRVIKSRVRKQGDWKDHGRELIRPPAPSMSLKGLLTRLKLEKTDAIGFYRRELQNITEDIEQYRKRPERFKPLPSAFVTFQNPLAAHMACQTVIHTKSGYMTPRTLPISVDDIVWDNVCIGWWERSVRTVLSNALIVTLSILCVVPAAFAGLLSQVIYLTRAITWLSWINELPNWSLGLIQGVLPPIILAILLKGFSSSLEFLVRKQGASSKSIIDLKVQDFYFYFLFVQVTLIVSLSAGLTTIVNEVASGGSLVATLAKNLPKASNYFVSYVLLQALSVSANALLRIDKLVGNFVLAPIFDRTVTQKLERKRGQDIRWGTFVPVYTNLACIGTQSRRQINMGDLQEIGILYAIISPIIIPFQVLIFALFWVIYSKSSMLLTERDSGGLFYPTALKHLLLGLYTMEIGLFGLFLLVRDSRGKAKCIGQACFMVFAIALTAVFHHLVRKAFDPLLYFSPTSTFLQSNNSSTNPSALFWHKALDSDPIIRIPKDDLGISLIESRETRRELAKIEISDHEATITTSGKIRLGDISEGC